METKVPGKLNFTTYRLPWDEAVMSESLKIFESACEGTYKIGKLQLTRKYIQCGAQQESAKISVGSKSANDAHKYTFYTCIENTER